MSLVLAGCGRSAKPERTTAAEPEPKDEVRHEAETGPLELQGFDEAGKPRWIVRAPRSEIAVVGSDRAQTEFDEVKGELFASEETAASTLEAGHAKVEKTARKLVLTKGVLITSEDDGSQLEAEQIVYREDDAVIEASGDVWLRRGGIAMGPMPALHASADLKRFATPEVWKW